MAIEEAITSLLSGIAGGRRYWGRAESISAADGAFLVLNVISAPRDYTMSGPSNYVETRIQMDIYAGTYTAVRDTAATAIAALNGYAGTVAATKIMLIRIESEGDQDATSAGEASHLFRRSVDLIVHHDE